MPRALLLMTLFLFACPTSSEPVDAGTLADAGRTDAGPTYFFADRFDDVGPLHPQLRDVGNTYAIANGVLANTMTQRNYIRTEHTGYNTLDFVYEVEYSNASGTGYPGIVFFGFGDGAQNPQFNGEPDYALVLHIDPTEFACGYEKAVMLCVQEHDPHGNDGCQPHRAMWELGRVERGAHVAQLKKQGDAMTFSIITNGVVEMTMTKSLATQAPFLNATNSRLFFGSMQNENTFNRVSVSPL